MWVKIVGVSTSEPQPSGTPLMSRTTSTDLQFFVSARNVGTWEVNSSASVEVSARMYTATWSVARLEVAGIHVALTVEVLLDVV